MLNKDTCVCVLATRCKARTHASSVDLTAASAAVSAQGAAPMFAGNGKTTSSPASIPRTSLRTTASSPSKS
jgi:hypothetical protein